MRELCDEYRWGEYAGLSVYVVSLGPCSFDGVRNDR